MAKEDDEGFENSNKCWTCDNVYVDDDVNSVQYGPFWSCSWMSWLDWGTKSCR